PRQSGNLRDFSVLRRLGDYFYDNSTGVVGVYEPAAESVFPNGMDEVRKRLASLPAQGITVTLEDSVEGPVTLNCVKGVEYMNPKQAGLVEWSRDIEKSREEWVVNHRSYLADFVLVSLAGLTKHSYDSDFYTPHTGVGIFQH
ncbi:MAG: hypothetical protein ABIE94_01295, partial [archaeon]